MYKSFIKRFLGLILSAMGIVVLTIPLLILMIVIKLDSPGPVLFKQKRVGIHKTYFEILKFRTMRVDAPKDVPTHLLKDPEQWVTGVGKILRKTSLDELPQIFNILLGQMAIVGPRPALWNQYDLIAERDKYGANDILPGLTGWAQINGRDELEVDEKARLDGVYTAALNAGRCKGLAMDIKCFLGTIGSVLKAKGFVEGAAEKMQKDKACPERQEQSNR